MSIGPRSGPRKKSYIKHPSQDDRLLFYFFKAGTDPLAFEPDFIHKMEKPVNGEWTEPEELAKEGEVIWQIGYKDGIYYGITDVDTLRPGGLMTLEMKE